MQQLLPLFLVVISLLSTSLIYGQNFEGCQNGPITFPDPKWRTVPSRFEIVTELVVDNEMLELSQAFSPQRDAVATSTSRGPINFYWNFGTNEQFETLTLIANQQAVQKCFRQELTGTSQTSVIAQKTLYVKPSILLGFGPRNEENTQWGNRYVGDTDLRGIPANKFIACFDVPDIEATVSATYYVSDVTKFQAYLRSNQSIILQIDVEIRNRNGRQDRYTYNVFRYVPNPSRREERQALETPSGVYCAGRTSTMDTPSNIPERLSSNSEAFMPQLNSSILSAHGLYDTEFRLTRFDVWFPDPFGGPQWLHYSEIHDFATGLNYQYNYTNHQCNVRPLTPGANDSVPVDGKPDLIQMGSPQHFFLLDDITYQYTGEKRCRDNIWCNVWIGEKSVGNKTIEHREWYWAANINGEVVKEPFPVKFLLRTSVDEIPTFTMETTIFNYVRESRAVFEVDATLADCYRALGPAERFNLAVLSFTIINDKNYPVLQNLNNLRFHIFETLIFTLLVRPIRISNVIADKDGDDILVSFTLLDAPPRTGPVENPLKEESLDTLVERLNSIIDANGFFVRARYGTKDAVLRAKSGSLNTQHKSTEDKPKTSGPKITGLWIGLIFVGLLFGAIGGFFALAKLSS
ncbi:unnamed protein product [Rotaria socialis]|uniref:Uncharacterized protein n=1 Tax=Rotaria socialis TaxID=392032 RepID=A0A817VKL4_9BILA|nr:unnamed protein product [Rotaria socialis]CAF3345341.1 unnamed protein product [Rotaria socialis]CAF4120399.1 unnamed protein product [Rotaria socialis]CAF4314959.1 unnamed protein product [Rotaria socialis]